MQGMVQSHFGANVDPDRTYLLEFKPHPKPAGWSGERIDLRTETHPKGSLVQATSLTDLPLYNYTPEQLRNSEESDGFFGKYGVYTDNDPDRAYRPSDALPIPPDGLYSALRASDFHGYMKAQVGRFFDDNKADYSRAIADQARSVLDNQYRAGALSREAYGLARRALGQAEGREGRVAVSPLDVHAWQAADALVFSDKDSQRQVLYLPADGEQRYRGFADGNALRDWVVDQATTNEGRERLAPYFSLSDRDGQLGWEGVDRSLKMLGDSRGMSEDQKKFSGDYWAASNVNELPAEQKELTGNFFDRVTDRVRNKSLSDLDYTVMSNSRLSAEAWKQGASEGLGKAMWMALPGALLAPAVFGPPLLAMFAAQGGMDAHTAFTQQGRGNRMRAFGSLVIDDTLPFLMGRRQPMVEGAKAGAYLIGGATQASRDADADADAQRRQGRR